MGEQLERSWLAFTNAPFLFLGAVLALGLLAWAVIHFLYRNRIEALKEELDRERRENARLGSQASPVEPTNARVRSAAAVALMDKSSASEVTVKRKLRDSRVFLRPEVTPSLLLSFYEGRPAHQGNKMGEPYLGKWMRVSGRVKNVHSRGKRGWSVVMEREDLGLSHGNLAIQFERDEAPVVETLNLGDRISAEGRLEKLEPFWIWLDGGRLVE